MPRRPAHVTQADIARAIRAMKAEGFTKVRVVVTNDGVAIEPTEKADSRTNDFGFDDFDRREPVELL